jgi:iron complex outermembrane receptor protein
MFSSRLLAASALAAIVAACPLHAETAAAVEAAPADAAAAEGDGLETITVTAQKRKEDLQSTPISISVLTNTALENRHVTSLLDLGDGAIPSLKVAPFFHVRAR